jgi:hypothetical protein
MTVSGFTIMSADFQSGNHFDIMTIKRRNECVARGFGLFPVITCCWNSDNWLLSIRFSSRISALDLNLKRMC